MKKNIYFFLALLLLFQTACKKEEFDVQVPNLYGLWERRMDNNAELTGLQIEIFSNKANVYRNNSNIDNFAVNTEKWRNIYPIRDSVFSYEDLGSDGRYYKGQMQYKIINDTTYLHCIIHNTSPGLGKNQTWLKL